MRRHEGIVYREEGRPDAPVALLLHGYPESSHMWRGVMSSVAAAGWRALAPDLPGFGDSPADGPGTWEGQVEAVDRLHSGLGLGPVALVVHDWGGLIGLRWACEHPGKVVALVISSTGFFSDGKWHGMARALRTEGTGEELLANMSREALGEVLRQASPSMDDESVDEYWKAFCDPDNRRGQLELYRSGDFEKLRPYEGQVAAMAAPALILWGENDPTVPVAAARRFEQEIRDTEVVILEGASHFLYDDEPERCAREVAAFLSRQHD